MTAISKRREASSLWVRFFEWVTSTENRLYVRFIMVVLKTRFQYFFVNK